ncbi:MAG: 23S rRNA (pseudouridine(1915)-N(3))-methyltransferase RlmH [Gemmatimonadota bacterium]
MRFRLCVVGKPRDKALADAIADYETRAARYWPLEIHEVKTVKAGDPATVRSAESQRLLDAAGAAVRVVCDERGKAMDSRTFARWLLTLQEQARDVAFLIGGAHGVTDSLRNDASRLLALAPWTLPHELARLVLAEQFYRAGTIARGEPYHK